MVLQRVLSGYDGWLLKSPNQFWTKQGRTKPTCSSTPWISLSTSPQSGLSWRVQLPQNKSAKKNRKRPIYFSKLGLLRKFGVLLS
jgi:hypothetical protein